MTSSPPVFVLSCPRSGSTLMRYILDTHPDLCCPGEIGIGALARHLLAAFDATSREGEPLDPSYVDLSRGSRELRSLRGHVSWSDCWPAKYSKQASIARTRQVIQDMLDRYAAECGARMWCERTPENAEELDVLQAVFPDAKYICLYRHSMDVTFSFLENVRFGVARDFAPMTRNNVTNFVTGIVDYWIQSVKQTLQLEERAPDRCYRITYEDLVKDPAPQVDALFRFVGVDPRPGLVEEVFQTRHDPGIGDAKTRFSTSIDRDRIDKGRAVPIARIPLEQRAAMNGLLRTLGYPEVGQDWNELATDRATPAKATRRFPRLDAPELQEHLADGLRRLTLRAGDRLAGTVRLVATGEAGRTWTMDLAARTLQEGASDAPVDLTVRLDASLFLKVMNKEIEMVELTRAGAVHLTGSNDLIPFVVQIIR